MNRAEYIIATIDHANQQHAIDQSESVRVLLGVASILNSGLDPDEIDNSLPMRKLWKEAHHKWGKL